MERRVSRCCFVVAGFGGKEGDPSIRIDTAVRVCACVCVVFVTREKEREREREREREKEKEKEKERERERERERKKKMMLLWRVYLRRSSANRRRNDTKSTSPL